MPDTEAQRLEGLLAELLAMMARHADSSEEHVLVEVLTAGEVTQQQIADRLGLDKSRISRLCTSLERKDLLERVRDESNRRNLSLRLTAAGRAEALRLRRHWRERHEEMLAAMTGREREGLFLGLGALAREMTVAHRARCAAGRVRHL
ncbi:MarR family winged helix-turn-helix transcriptional regulator [Streptomyces smaragdinus]|uniref:MarR family winged helix-turn-helix transcriptional regulator n=1 Tax=Streptomyces smaragdinus TaxID=2585196 RepID=UPI0018867AC8|nr:MarR family transcriptional regulator [Streptomyces smaragdinus]